MVHTSENTQLPNKRIPGIQINEGGKNPSKIECEKIQREKGTKKKTSFEI